MEQAAFYQCEYEEYVVETESAYEVEKLKEQDDGI